MYDFSVIIPTYNRSAFLLEAAKSVLAQQEQVELIIVDDASTDRTAELVQELIRENSNIVYLRNKKSLFAHGSRKRGYMEAQGKYIVFMDDDDYYIDNHFFSDAKRILDEYTEVSTVIGSTVGVRDRKYGDPIDLGGNGLIPNREYFNGFLKEYSKPLSSLTAVFRKESLDAVGLAESKMINDTCLYLRGILNGDIYLLNKPVAAYRFHGSNISGNSFSLDFILATLNEKLNVYKYAKKAQKLDDKADWLDRNLSISILYFLNTNKRDIKCICGIFIWILLYGSGVQLVFLRKLIKKLLHK